MEVLRPALDVLTTPDSTDSQCGEWLREVVALVHELIHALTGHAEYPGDLGNADRVTAHRLIIRIA